jgi:ketosteroid isomerase-like protein
MYQNPSEQKGENIKMNPRLIKILVLIFALVTVTVITILQGQSNSSADQTEVEKAILARLDEIQNAAQALDTDKVFSYVMENDKGSLIQNGKLFLTRQEALESNKQGFAGLQKVEYQFDQQYVTLLSPTVALATGEGLSTATLKDGRTLNTRFAQSVIFVLTNGEWKVFHAHRSFPPAK